ncbi:PREDICTED: CASP-like protein 4A1 [Theobroma cacao]|uniref:CASP-like protein n=1 Tax=Theobroma cacao TaxID=3641 RepID=A0AB32V7J4_THECC|nr:PREDICTED: CASP-like protein 4A1 [Theobroma cacao]
MENEEQEQKEDKRQHHHQEEDKQQQNHQEEDKEQQQERQHHHQKLQEEEEKQQQHHQEQQNHREEEQEQRKQQQEQQKQEEKEEKEPENKQNHTVSRFPLSKRSTPPRTIPKAQSPPSNHSPVDSPLSTDHSSLSHGFSPPQPTSKLSDPNFKPPSLVVSTVEFTSRDQSTTTTTTTVEVEEQSQKLGSGSGKRLRPDLSILRRTKRDKMVKKALLGFRISGFVFCLVSFSVLAADRDQGWALDSFYRYKEFRFCMAVNVIGFVYSGSQAYDLAYQLTFGKQKPRSRLRCYLDFVLDQMLAYLLLSASSSAAVRVDDWQSNWGKDKFPEMATASMALSLVAFIALALSSLVSGYTLSTFRSM